MNARTKLAQQISSGNVPAPSFLSDTCYGNCFPDKMSMVRAGAHTSLWQNIPDSCDTVKSLRSCCPGNSGIVFFSGRSCQSKGGVTVLPSHGCLAYSVTAPVLTATLVWQGFTQKPCHANRTSHFCNARSAKLR